MDQAARPHGTARSVVAILAIAVAVSVAQLADLLTFQAMVANYGLEAEANPIVATATAALGVDAMAAAKVGLVGLVVLVYGLLHRPYGQAGSVVATLAVVAGIIGAWSNTLVLMA